ncbi:uncharacterized protein LACBIDRAFT_328853 [Laccaria bicolor S238N-H82]|uniref:Predicted protein n=1 Tax=Laccaria bicolor (strain S238N-H82 / ATCC MYA-4686) TaxID=486041 RepID=B0DG71_LACBS|nr:uncharacterized protein LACBIDRAFT_328853 [Laccaria bicolor S238N-H82]EDR06462.1 predicted protein [Laccaria bicolor S238N-H82]|eukprot:XP_001882834.1 predicted protein [Laccaria bicolor S238N-H82]
MDLDTLQAVCDASLLEFGKSKNTNKAYAGHIAQGKKFLANVVAERDTKGIEVCDKGIPTTELAKAFDKPPNRYSAVALEFFLVQKVFTKELSRSYAEGIQGAFADYWDKMDEQMYAGAYALDKATAPAIHDLMKAVKTRAGTKGAAATRKHAEAMLLEDLQKIMAWSEEKCPNEFFDNAPSSAQSDVALMNMHGLMQALCPTLFMLMLRVFEGLSLQNANITQGLNGPAPYHFPFFEVKLEERKNWQKQAGYDGPHTNIAEMDMYTHLLCWLKHLESRIGHSLQPDDFVFPYISQNGTINPKHAMSYDTFQKLLSEFAAGAGLTKVYTTHCFQCGGAQYRFMYAPIGRHWSLSIIRWWGGWAKGEQVDTMIKYLIDSLQSYETGHGNALCLIPNEADKSFMGEHVNQAPPSTEEIRQWKLSMDRSLNNAVSEIVGQVTTAIAGTRLSQSPSPEPDMATTSNDVALQERTICHGWDSRLPTSMPYPPRSSSRTQSLGASSSGDDTDGSATMQSTGSNPPIPGVVIRDVKNWRGVIQQWEVGDAGMVALKDWPKEWYQGNMKKYTGSLYSQRKKIAEEYECLGRDEELFQTTYPAADRSIKALLKAIRVQHNERRRSKNGTPEEHPS